MNRKEESYLDRHQNINFLSQEGNDKGFARAGKQNHKTPTIPFNASLKNRNSDTAEKETITKNPSKHQQKSARRAERVRDSLSNMSSCFFLTDSD